MLTARQRSQSISSPLAQDFPSPAAPPVSFVRPSHKANRPSLSNTMSRFKDSLKERLQENVQAVHGHVHRRAHSNGSARGDDGSYAKRSVYISEPQLNSSLDSLPSTRLAPLGSGAVVVGTPQEALALSAQRGGYRGPFAAASAPSRINQLPNQHPTLVEEESEYEEDSQKSPALPPLPSSRPNSPAMQNRGLQMQQREWAQPRRSGESNASGSSRGLGPILPDRRSRASVRGSAGNGRSSPLAQLNTQMYAADDSQGRSVLLHRPKSDPEYSSTPTASAGGEIGMQRALAQPQRKSSTDADPTRPKNFSSYSDPGCRHEVQSDCFTAAPQLPVDLATALPQPTFEPVLMSNLPANMHKFDPAKVIVVLETGDRSMKSTLKTLTSRPSYLATYLNELVASTLVARDPSAQTQADENGDNASVYSQHSEFEDSEAEENYAGFNSLFQDHLKSTGVLKPLRKPQRRADATSSIHVFLDRPSAPYAHIITYLRAPILQSHPEGMLPYAARLFPAASHSFATARLEALLDLRDEAAYLGLTDLMRLCDEELAGQVPLATDTGRSSVHSTHTLCNSSVVEADGGAGAGGGTNGKESTSEELVSSVHSVDIPIVLPSHESRVVGSGVLPLTVQKTASTGSSKSTRDDRTAVQAQGDNVTKTRVPMPMTQTQRVNRILNASQLRAAKPSGNYF